MDPGTGSFVGPHGVRMVLNVGSHREFGGSGKLVHVPSMSAADRASGRSPPARAGTNRPEDAASTMADPMPPSVEMKDSAAPHHPFLSDSLVHVFHNHADRLRLRFTQPTPSTHDQEETELECEPYFTDLSQVPASQLEHLRQTGLLMDHIDPDARLSAVPRRTHHRFGWVGLVSDAHREYVSTPLSAQQPALPWNMCSLDASRVWLLYWCLQSQDLLLSSLSTSTSSATLTTPTTQASHRRIVDTIASMWREETVLVAARQVQEDEILQRLAMEQDTVSRPTQGDDWVAIRIGGFGGGPSQLAHAATTYAAVLALCILWGTDEDDDSHPARELLQQTRYKLYAWMVLVLQQPDGTFRMHEDGEIDVRATYCLMSVASLLNIDRGSSWRRSEAVAFIAACQTYEGGFGGAPGCEAHGGYTFCALAAAVLLQGLDRIDTDTLTEWLVRRQMSFEGGFQGRTNKLVDGCYSFWVGAATAIVSMLPHARHGDPWLPRLTDKGDWNLNHQVLFDQGMLERYILTCAQNTKGGLRDKPSKNRDHYHTCYNLSGLSVAQSCSGDQLPSFGHPQHSQVAKTHPIYNIRVERVREVLAHFQGLDRKSGAAL